VGGQEHNGLKAPRKRIATCDRRPGGKGKKNKREDADQGALPEYGNVIGEVKKHWLSMVAIQRHRTDWNWPKEGTKRERRGKDARRKWRDWERGRDKPELKVRGTCIK